MIQEDETRNFDSTVGTEPEERLFDKKIERSDEPSQATIDDCNSLNVLGK